MAVCRTLLAALLLPLLLATTGALDLEEFLGGRPLTKDRIITDILQYYQRDHPSGIPVLVIPEPFVIDKEYQGTLVSLADIRISGLSQLRLEHVNINVTTLQVSLLIRLPWLEVLAKYSYDSFFTSTVGGMNLTFINLDILLEAELGPDYNAMLEVADLQVVISKEAFLPLFTNSTADLSLIVSAADTLFDTIIGNAVSGKMEGLREKLTERLQQRMPDKRFPAGVLPVDLLLAGVKADLKHKFDPFNIPPKTRSLPAGVELKISGATVEGLSTLHRTHEVSLQLIDDRLLLVVQIGTQKVTASADVEVVLPVLPALSGHLEFSIDSVGVWIELEQSADVRHPPRLRRLHIELGNFRLLSSGDSTLSYVLEAAVNAVPNALRGIIIKRLEPRLHQVIQRRLSALDVQQLINARLEKMRQQAAVEATN